MNVEKDAGMVTAEFAVALPALVLVLALALGALGLALDQVRCVDAARAGARAAARGDDVVAVRAEAGRVAPQGSTVVVRLGATVEVEVTGPPAVRFVPGAPMARAVAALPAEGVMGTP